RVEHANPREERRPVVREARGAQAVPGSRRWRILKAERIGEGKFIGDVPGPFDITIAEDTLRVSRAGKGKLPLVGAGHQSVELLQVVGDLTVAAAVSVLCGEVNPFEEAGTQRDLLGRQKASHRPGSHIAEIAIALRVIEAVDEWRGAGQARRRVKRQADIHRSSILQREDLVLVYPEGIVLEGVEALVVADRRLAEYAVVCPKAVGLSRHAPRLDQQNVRALVKRGVGLTLAAVVVVARSKAQARFRHDSQIVVLEVARRLHQVRRLV